MMTTPCTINVLSLQLSCQAFDAHPPLVCSIQLNLSCCSTNILAWESVPAAKPRARQPPLTICCAHASQNAGIGQLSATPARKMQSLEDVADQQWQGDEQRQGFLINSNGWGVLRVDPNDMDIIQQFADVQAQAFHIPAAIFNDFFYSLFKAEVLSSLLYKMRHATPKRFACLVAISDNSQVTKRKVVGVVDAAAMGDKHVLRSLPGVDEYLYISGMAVDPDYRRQKIATVLLQACDLTALEWGFEYLVLQAYEDDKAARCLYARAGYTIISMDPLWLSKWLGRRRRVVLAKKTPQQVFV